MLQDDGAWGPEPEPAAVAATHTDCHWLGLADSRQQALNSVAACSVAAEIGGVLMEEIEEQLDLLEMAGDQWSLEGFLKGEISPIFWGSAMTNFLLGRAALRVSRVTVCFDLILYYTLNVDLQ